MARLQLPESFGFVEVAIGDHATRIDVWEANNTYAQLQQQHGNDHVVALGEFVGWLGLKGLPGLSHGAAIAVVDAVSAEIASAKKPGPC